MLWGVFPMQTRPRGFPNGDRRGNSFLLNFHLEAAVSVSLVSYKKKEGRRGRKQRLDSGHEVGK